MAATPIYGLWRVVSSTDSIFAPGMTLTFTARPDGLAIESLEGTGSTTPWLTVRHSVAAHGQSVVETAGGTLELDPVGDARTSDLAFAVASRRVPGQDPRSSAYPEYPAGDGQVLVLYRSADTGDELAPAPLLAAIAAAAAIRSAAGWRMTSIVSLPLRHAGQKVFGVDGSGCTTRAAFGALYTLVDLDTDWLTRPSGVDGPRS